MRSGIIKESSTPRGHAVTEVRELHLLILEHEALAETGNIILNACLATIANVLRQTMRMSLPAVVRGDGGKLFDVQSDAAHGSLVLFLYIDFTVKNREFAASSLCYWICRRLAR